MKRASSPQPFFATYQSEWEEVVVENKSNADSDIPNYVVDKSKTRGFSRAPSPEEIRIPMHYAIGAGAHGLFAFMSSTEFAGVYIHGSLDMPEIWRAVTNTSRALRVVAPLVQISHPTDWCKSGNSSLWMKTLLCGEKVALVVAVNEACKSENDSFVSSPVMNASFSFTDLPWLIASKVYKLGDGRLGKVVSTKQGKILNWSEASIADGDVYLVCADSNLADELVERYNSRPPQANPEGRQAAVEGPLKGRRKSSDAR
jgi:hypothetical protein